jgi:N6-adenosine-specific RNA methylase IME4
LLKKSIFDLAVDAMEPLLGALGSLLISGEFWFQLRYPIFSGSQLIRKLLRRAERVAAVFVGSSGCLSNQLQYGLPRLVELTVCARRGAFASSRERDDRRLRPATRAVHGPRCFAPPPIGCGPDGGEPRWLHGNSARSRCSGYDVIVADPPWDFENYSDAGTKKGADPHYRVMPLEAIKALPAHELARSCLLPLWTTGWAIATGQALNVARAWGFKPLSDIVWFKRIPAARVGTGYRVRTMHEPILNCTVGNPQHKPFPSTFDGIARRHSRKPTEFYDLVLSHTPRAFWRTIYSAERSQLDLRAGETSKANSMRGPSFSALTAWKPHHSTQRFKQTLTAGYYVSDGTVGTGPPLRPGPWRVRNRVVPVPCQGLLTR